MKKIIWIVLVLVAIGIAGYVYVFHKPHRDIAGESAKYELKAESLKTEYADNVSTADALYLDQVLQVSGEIEELDATSIKLVGGVFCSLDSNQAAHIEDYAVGTSVTVKGRCLGYDELFEEVKLDNCQISQ